MGTIDHQNVIKRTRGHASAARGRSRAQPATRARVLGGALLCGAALLGTWPQNASAQPINDACAAATMVGSGTTPFTLVGATNDAEGSCGATETAPDVWFAYTAAATGAARVETCGLASFDTVLAIFAGCGGPEIDCNDDACGTLSAIDLAVSAGATYVIRVAGFNGAIGSGSIRVSETDVGPANDLCLDAQTVTVGTHPFTTVGATNDGTAACGTSNTSPDVWFAFTAPSPGTLRVETCGMAAFDTVLSIHTACGAADLVCNDDACGLQSRVELPVMQDSAYLIRASGFNNISGAGSIGVSFSASAAGPDLVIRDHLTDSGAPFTTGVLWDSPDIWVRHIPDSNWTPCPFPFDQLNATAGPGALTGTPGSCTGLAGPGMAPPENPEYRDPRLSVPNYIYVRVTNMGNMPSLGTERLRVYWAKASTGLAWPNNWVDHLDSICGPTTLYGREITKVRSNVACVSAAERTKLLNAVLALDTIVYYDLFGNGTTDGVSYWDKQDQIHQATHVHQHPSFLPWHRELINRFEVLLQEVDPTVMLHYWNWTQNPRSVSNCQGGFLDLMTPAFMGGAVGHAGAPFTSFDNNFGCGVGARRGLSHDTCSTFDCGTSLNPAHPPLAIVRGLPAPSVTPGLLSDATILNQPLYPAMRSNTNGLENAHNQAHGYFGSANPSSIGCDHTAFEDPFVYLLHSNVDRLFAQWQRNTANLHRLDSNLVYGLESNTAHILDKMEPWNVGSAMFPWDSAGGHGYDKDSKTQSVVSPPYYDTAPLVVPVLQPNESVILQIPWYPPNPQAFACFGSLEMGHVCIAARIEEDVLPPFGMTTPEGTGIYANTSANNNIAWRNLNVLDQFNGTFKTSGVLVRNVHPAPTVTKFCFNVPPDQKANPLFAYGTLTVTLQPALHQLWLAGGAQGDGLQQLPDGRIRVLQDGARIENILLSPDATHGVNVTFELSPGYPEPAGNAFGIDMTQNGAPGDPNAVIGGQRFTMDFNKLVPVPAGSVWKYLDTGSDQGTAWRAPGFNDSTWASGAAELGFGNNPVTTVNGGPKDNRFVTTYFRRQFTVSDPAPFRSLRLRIKRDDGAVVYLNGVEVLRTHMPAGNITFSTLASSPAVDGLEEDALIPFNIDAALSHLTTGTNVLAVEVHQRTITSEDLGFDLELSANNSPVITNEVPVVGRTAPSNGSLFQIGQNIELVAEALDFDGDITGVTFVADGVELAEDTASPFAFTWSNASLGAHSVSFVATDSGGLSATSTVNIVVVTNLLPEVAITSPANRATLNANTPFTITATASDSEGSVTRVDFFVEEKLVGTDSTSPYSATLPGLAPGFYTLIAEATDNSEGTVMSRQVLVTVVTGCPCDWNHDAIINSQDFFDFINRLFAGDADFNGDGITNSQDFFDFLNCFFNPPTGCP